MEGKLHHTSCYYFLGACCLIQDSGRESGWGPCKGEIQCQLCGTVMKTK